MSEDFVRFVRSNAIYSKTSDTVRAALFGSEVFLFIDGMPMRHRNFLHFAISAVNPYVERPQRVTDLLLEDAHVLLGHVGLDLEGPDAAKHISIVLRGYLKVDGSEKDYANIISNLLDEIETLTSVFGTSFTSGGSLNDYMFTN